MWYHVADQKDAAWCYPDPIAGRESIKNHVTFVTGKGILVQELGRSGGGCHESAGAKRGKAAAARSRLPTADAAEPVAAPVAPAAQDGLSTGSERLFDREATSDRFLGLDDPRTVRCHTNGRQASQGTAFIAPPIRPGELATLTIHCRQKPGRMRYFIGAAPRRFDVDAGQAAIQAAAYSLETLKAAPNRPRAPCASSAPPCFHAASRVTMTVDRRRAPGTVSWRVDSTGVAHTVPIEPATHELHAFVSLYNREAVFELQ